MTSLASAIGLVTRFGSSADQRPEAFRNIRTTRPEFAAELLARLRDPGLIQQGNASLCGPAAFMYFLVKARPEVYARYAIDLYESGKGSVGRMSVVPSSSCRAAVIDGGRIGPVDWITLASLRDANNDIFAYDSPSDQVPGTTFPSSLASWLSRTGLFRQVTNETNLVFDKEMCNLVEANRAFGLGKQVALFVGAELFVRADGGTWFPNHWVVLTSPIRVGGKPLPAAWPRRLKYPRSSRTRGGKKGVLEQYRVNPAYAAALKDVQDKRVSFDFFSWGDGSRTVDPLITVDTFFDYFYGYVAAV